jgi:hypothetical protein
MFTTQWFTEIERALVGLAVAPTATEKKAGKVGGGV